MKHEQYRAAFLAIVMLCAADVARAELPRFELTERLGHRWAQERVTYALTDAQVADLNRGAALFDANGQEVLYQLDAETKQAHLLVTLEPFGEQVYTFKPDVKPQAMTDLRVSKPNNSSYLELVNSRFGVRINETLAAGSGPLHSWRLPSGTWAGGTRLESGSAVTDYQVEILSSGAVVDRVRCSAQFANGGTWTLEFELQAFEPLVKVSETFDCRSDPGSARIVFSRDFTPDSILYRMGGGFDHRGRKLSLGSAVLDQVSTKPGKAST